MNATTTIPTCFYEVPPFQPELEDLLYDGEDYRTFTEWSSAGYAINKGSKATYIDGIAKFSEDQVTKNSFHGYSDDDEMYDMGEYDYCPMDAADFF